MVTPALVRPDAAPMIEFEGAAKVRRWLVGDLEIIGIGMVLPIGILVVGMPVALVIRLLIELAQRL